MKVTGEKAVIEFLDLIDQLGIAFIFTAGGGSRRARKRIRSELNELINIKSRRLDRLDQYHLDMMIRGDKSSLSLLHIRYGGEILKS